MWTLSDGAPQVGGIPALIYIPGHQPQTTYVQENFITMKSYRDPANDVSDHDVYDGHTNAGVYRGDNNLRYVGPGVAY